MQHIHKIAKPKQMLMLSLIFTLGTCSLVSLLQSRASLAVAHYPRVHSVAGPPAFPSLSGSFKQHQWVIQRVQFFTTYDGRYQVAAWYQQQGWQPIDSKGQWWWQGRSSPLPISVSHSTIIYEDYRRETCRREATCIFVKTAVIINLPDLNWFDQ